MELERGIVTAFNETGGCGFVKVGDLELTILDEDGRAIALVEGQPRLTKTPTDRQLKSDDQVVCEVDHGRFEQVVRWGFADEYDVLIGQSQT